MKKHNQAGWWAVLTILLLLVIDQVIKVWVKTHMSLGESIDITSWFKIVFIENNGMAYGMTFFNKIVLSLFRIVAVTAIGIYIYNVVKGKHHFGFIICLAMLFAGAAGNIFDCLFYGQIFTVSTPFNVAEFVPFGQGYAPVLEGRVVDMFYFPLFEFNWPDWLPYIGGKHHIFFSPVFNFADSCISVAVVLLLIFYRSDLETFNEEMGYKLKVASKDKEASADKSDDKK